MTTMPEDYADAQSCCTFLKGLLFMGCRSIKTASTNSTPTTTTRN